MAFAALCAALTLSAPPAFEVRLGMSDLTPPEPLALGGFTERRGALGIQGKERLMARCVLVRQGGQQAAMVSVESLTMPESLRDEVRKRIPAGITLFIGATHTHSAPDSQMLNKRMTFAIPGIAAYRSRWETWFADRIADAMLAAVKAPAWRGGLELAVGEASVNRARRPGAKPDPAVTVVFGARPLVGVYAAHATIYDEKSNAVSGDWPGLWMRRGPYVAFPGAIGDVSPASDGGSYEERTRRMVENLVETVDKSATFPAGREFAISQALIRLDKPRPSQAFLDANRIPAVLAQGMVDRFAPSEASITMVRLGRLVLVGVPGEPTSEVAKRIRLAGAMQGFRQVVVVSHVNGWMGYILDAADFARGGYEASLSFYGSTTADRVVEACDRAFQDLGMAKSGRAQSR